MYRGASFLHDDGSGPIVHVKCRADKDALAVDAAAGPVEGQEADAVHNEGEGGSLQAALDGAVAALGGAEGGAMVADGAGWEGGEHSVAQSELRVPKQEGVELGATAAREGETGEVQYAEGDEVRQPPIGSVSP